MSDLAAPAGEGRSRFLLQLLTPFVILALLGAAAAAWVATVQVGQQHLHGQVERMQPEAVGEAPLPYTQEFRSAAVPLKDSPRIYLYVSPTTRQYLASTGADYNLLLNPWRSFFQDHAMPFTETEDLMQVPGSSTTVLVLPSSLALDAKERQRLVNLQEQGVNMLATWALGGRDAQGEWLGHEFVQSLFDMRVLGELDPQSEDRFLNLHGDLPTTVGYPAGLRIWLENTAERALILGGAPAAARYMDWNRTGKPGGVNAAVLYDEHDAKRGHARWVLFGFPETAWGEQTVQLSGLIRNSLHWLGRGTTLAAATWPSPYRAAYIIEMDTEEGFGNARRFAAMMDEIGARATFYSLTSEAVRFPYLVRDLARRHEIALHGDVHDGFRGQSEAEQDQRLRKMFADMRAVVGDEVPMAGFRAPYEAYDMTTERLLHARGLRHHAADPNRTEARIPFYSQAGGSTPASALVVLPRTQNDDISLRAGEQGEQAAARLLASLVADFNNARDMGALGLLSVHSQYFGSGSLLDRVMPDFLRHVNRHRGDVWIDAANEVAEWWRERERLQFRISGAGPRFRLTVRIDGNRPLSRGALLLARRGALAPVLVHPVQDGARLPEIRRVDAFRSALVFDGFEPGSFVYTVEVLAPPAVEQELARIEADRAATAMREAVLKRVRAWAAAWSARDFEAYLSFYSNELELPANMTREDWIAFRRGRIVPRQKISVVIQEPVVTLDGERATVKFRQLYASDGFEADDQKELVFVREQGKWRIRRERVQE